jgi:hypothetical protein
LRRRPGDAAVDGGGHVVLLADALALVLGEGKLELVELALPVFEGALEGLLGEDLGLLLDVLLLLGQLFLAEVHLKLAVARSTYGGWIGRGGHPRLHDGALHVDDSDAGGLGVGGVARGGEEGGGEADGAEGDGGEVSVERGHDQPFFPGFFLGSALAGSGGGAGDVGLAVVEADGLLGQVHGGLLKVDRRLVDHHVVAPLAGQAADDGEHLGEDGLGRLRLALLDVLLVLAHQLLEFDGLALELLQTGLALGLGGVTAAFFELDLLLAEGILAAAQLGLPLVEELLEVVVGLGALVGLVDGLLHVDDGHLGLGAGLSGGEQRCCHDQRGRQELDVLHGADA